MSPGQIVLFVIGTIVIIVGAYYVTYYIGVKSTNLRRGAGRSIVLRDRFSISKDKSFCLVEIYGKIYIVGVTNQTMTLLDTLEAGSVEEKEAAKEREKNRSAVISGTMAGRASSLLTMLFSKQRGGGFMNAERRDSFAEKLRAAAREDRHKNDRQEEQASSGAEGCEPEERE